MDNVNAYVVLVCIAGNDRNRRIPISGKRTRAQEVAEILQKAGMDAVVPFPICSTTFFDRFKCAEVLSHCILVENNHRSKRGLDRDHCDRARVGVG